MKVSLVVSCFIYYFLFNNKSVVETTRIHHNKIYTLAGNISQEPKPPYQYIVLETKNNQVCLQPETDKTWVTKGCGPKDCVWSEKNTVWIGRSGSKEDKETFLGCSKLCDGNNKCKFFILNTKSGWCGLFASCDTFRSGAPTATVYQKQLQSCKLV